MRIEMPWTRVSLLPGLLVGALTLIAAGGCSDGKLSNGGDSSLPGSCGNGRCDQGESCGSCSSDCGMCDGATGLDGSQSNRDSGSSRDGGSTSDSSLLPKPDGGLPEPDGGTTPGPEPVNPNASQKTRDVLRMLYELPNRPDHKVISGQVIRPLDSAALDPYPDPYDRIQMIYDKFGVWVGIIGAEYGDWGKGGLNQKILSDVLNPLIIAHAKKGAIAVLHFHPMSPRNGSDQDPGIIADEVLNPGQIHDNWMRLLSDAADGLAELRDNGVVVIWRPMHGSDLGWWWSPGGGGLSNADYRRVWTHMVDYFSSARGLDNILYFQSWYGGGTFADIKQLYAGDSNVDIVGIDHNEWSQAEYETITSFGKPVAISESWGGSGGADPDYDLRRIIENIKQTAPRCTFFVQFDHPRYPNVHISAYSNGGELLADPWVLNAPIF